ncbi:MAG: type II toxin-antitoxin system HicB family antitoxin [Lachnospiraceae bacterium]
MKFVYPAVFKKREDESFHVAFPDLEGCFAEGPTMEDALEKAKEAEIDWITLELEESFDLPARSKEEDIPVEEGDVIRNVTATIRLRDGYDE